MVVCVTGDGGIQMNIQELSTALQYELPVLVLNLNNRYLGMVKQWQDMIYSGRHSQSYMRLPDFVRTAEAYGHVGLQINHPDELEVNSAKPLSVMRNNRLVFVDNAVDGSGMSIDADSRGGMDEILVKQNGEDLMMRRILSLLLENSLGRYRELSAFFRNADI